MTGTSFETYLLAIIANIMMAQTVLHNSMEDAMGASVGQTSQYEPAVIYDGVSMYHMIFCSQDSSNRLLYCNSKDGENWNYVGQIAGDTTGSSPAIALSQSPSFSGPPNPNFLVAIYRANDPSNRILYSTLNINDMYAGWVDGGQVGNESAKWISALARQGQRAVTLYYLSNDPSNRILWTQFTPAG